MENHDLEKHLIGSFAEVINSLIRRETGTKNAEFVALVLEYQSAIHPADEGDPFVRAIDQMADIAAKCLNSTADEAFAVGLGDRQLPLSLAVFDAA